MPPPASSRAAITTTARQGHTNPSNQIELITLEPKWLRWWWWCGRCACMTCLSTPHSSHAMNERQCVHRNKVAERLGVRLPATPPPLPRPNGGRYTSTLQTTGSQNWLTQTSKTTMMPKTKGLPTTSEHSVESKHRARCTKPCRTSHTTVVNDERGHSPQAKARMNGQRDQHRACQHPCPRRTRHSLHLGKC